MSVAADVTIACWVLLELAVRVREAAAGRGGRAHDRGTRLVIAVAIGLAILTASVASAHGGDLRIGAVGRAAGVVAMWLGIATRGLAIAALGRSFRTTVEVDPGQAVVTT